MYSWKIDPELASSLPTGKQVEARQLGMPYECGLGARPTSLEAGSDVVRSVPLASSTNP